ncbi:MAG: hypothetical protein R3D88_07320 [Alphaproteobacteria bacterium]|nr:hypothetical protein [Alphaproteobacteria bacterium]
MSLLEAYQLAKGAAQNDCDSLSGDAKTQLQSQLTTAEEIVSGASKACREYLEKSNTQHDQSFLGTQRAKAAQPSSEDHQKFVTDTFNALITSNPLVEDNDLAKAAIAAAVEIFETEIGFKPEIPKP